MTTSEPSDDSANSSVEGIRTPSKRRFSASTGQSADQYLSQLLTQKRYKKMSDDEMSDDEEEAETQVRHAGYIKKLTLKNFMCHDNFELSFGPHMNFIIGRNGSGKSAIITGISVGLGAKATDTSRGSTTKNLIKDGKSIARIIVQIENDGLNAYEPETYGKTITVERKLMRDGQNSYAIKSENGSVVSNKRKTLDEITQRFSIFVNNPLSFLSQDKAREFIASSTEQTRYTHFSEGTNIRAIIQNYQEASKNIQKLQDRSAAAKSYFKEATSKYLESERVYKKHKQSHTLRQQSEKIHGKIYWFNVELMRKMIDKKEMEVSEKRNLLQTIDQGIEADREGISQTGQELVGIRSEKSKVEEELVSQEANFTRTESMYDDAARKVQNVVSDLKNYKSEVEDYTKQIKKHKAELVLEQKKIDDVNGGSKEVMTKKLELLKDHQEKLMSSRDDISRQLSEGDRVSPQMEALNKEFKDIASSKISLKEKMASVEKSKSDRFAAFGLNVSRLIKDIDRETHWHQRPIGPVGCNVSVKENSMKWVDLINSTLQRQLDSFVVCDEHDRKILNGIMKKNGTHKNIIVRRFEKFSFSNQVSSRYSTMLDALEFQNEDAKFTLIDSSGIEEFVLCDSVSQGEDVTRDHSVRQAFCLSDRRSGTRISRRDGHLSRDPVFYSRDLRKLAGKVDSQSFTRDLEDISRQEALVQEQRKKLQTEERDMRTRLQDTLNQKKVQLKKISNSIFEAEKILQEEGDHERIANLNQQIELWENQIKTREGMSMELLSNLTDCKKDLQTFKDQLEEEKQAKQSTTKKLTDCENKIDGHQLKISQLEAKIIDAEKKKIEIVASLESLRRTIFEHNEKLDELTKLAEERCERSEVTISESDTSKSITAEYKSIQQAIEEMERQNEKSFEEVQMDLLDAKSLKDKCEQTLIEIDNARVNLENDLNSRFDNLNITMQEKLRRAKQSFESSLALRGFKGKLEFDFNKKRVIMEVQTEDNKDTRAVQSLSGGEKSFTQIAFLLSIWKVMKPRVCGLDEFDVFMDSVNRTIAIRLLVHELRGSVAQSIFVTPQDIAMVGDLHDSADVKIHQISSPRSD